jgi:hypothetical protein
MHTSLPGILYLAVHFQLKHVALLLLKITLFWLILTFVVIETAVFWDLTPCSLIEVYWTWWWMRQDTLKYPYTYATLCAVTCQKMYNVSLKSHFPCMFLAFVKRHWRSIPYLLQKFHINTHNLCRCTSAFLILLKYQKVVITLKMNIHRLHKIQLKLRWNN